MSEGVIGVSCLACAQIIQVQTSSEFDSKGEGVIPVAGHVHKH